MYSFGIKRAFRGIIDPVTGLGTAMESVGDIYLDTCDFTRAAGAKTPHYSQQEPNAPKITFTKKGIASLKFSIMNATAPYKKAYMGGTITTLEGKDTWNEPRDTEQIHYFYEFETTDGQIIRVYKGETEGVENYKFRDQGILLIDVTVTPLIPDVAGLPATSSTDAPTVIV